MKRLRAILAGILSLAMMLAMLPACSLSASADDALEKFPYMIFASSDEEGAVSFNVSNGYLNGSVAANGTIEVNGSLYVNGGRNEHAVQPMIIALNKLYYMYFCRDDVWQYSEDYHCADTNICIDSPLCVSGNVSLTGSISQNRGIMASGSIEMNGGVINACDTVICSEAGDIDIEGTCVNLGGLVYAPYGEVRISGQNINLNNVLILAEKVTLQGDVLNANYNQQMAELIGTETEVRPCLWSFGAYEADTDSIFVQWMSTVPKGLLC